MRVALCFVAGALVMALLAVLWACEPDIRIRQRWGE